MSTTRNWREPKRTPDVNRLLDRNQLVGTTRGELDRRIRKDEREVVKLEEVALEGDA